MTVAVVIVLFLHIENGVFISDNRPKPRLAPTVTPTLLLENLPIKNQKPTSKKKKKKKKKVLADHINNTAYLIKLIIWKYTTVPVVLW